MNTKILIGTLLSLAVLLGNGSCPRTGELDQARDKDKAEFVDSELKAVFDEKPRNYKYLEQFLTEYETLLKTTLGSGADLASIQPLLDSLKATAAKSTPTNDEIAQFDKASTSLLNELKAAFKPITPAKRTEYSEAVKKAWTDAKAKVDAAGGTNAAFKAAEVAVNALETKAQALAPMEAKVNKGTTEKRVNLLLNAAKDLETDINAAEALTTTAKTKGATVSSLETKLATYKKNIVDAREKAAEKVKTKVDADMQAVEGFKDAAEAAFKQVPEKFEQDYVATNTPRVAGAKKAASDADATNNQLKALALTLDALDSTVSGTLNQTTIDLVAQVKTAVQNAKTARDDAEDWAGQAQTRFNMAVAGDKDAVTKVMQEAVDKADKSVKAANDLKYADAGSTFDKSLPQLKANAKLVFDAATDIKDADAAITLAATNPNVENNLIAGARTKLDGITLLAAFSNLRDSIKIAAQGSFDRIQKAKNEALKIATASDVAIASLKTAADNIEDLKGFLAFVKDSSQKAEEPEKANFNTLFTSLQKEINQEEGLLRKAEKQREEMDKPKAAVAKPTKVVGEPKTVLSENDKERIINWFNDTPENKPSSQSIKKVADAVGAKIEKDLVAQISCMTFLDFEALKQHQVVASPLTLPMTFAYLVLSDKISKFGKQKGVQAYCAYFTKDADTSQISMPIWDKPTLMRMDVAMQAHGVGKPKGVNVEKLTEVANELNSAILKKGMFGGKYEEILTLYTGKTFDLNADDQDLTKYLDELVKTKRIYAWAAKGQNGKEIYVQLDSSHPRGAVQLQASSVPWRDADQLKKINTFITDLSLSDKPGEPLVQAFVDEYNKEIQYKALTGKIEDKKIEVDTLIKGVKDDVTKLTDFLEEVKNRPNSRWKEATAIGNTGFKNTEVSITLK